MRRTCTRLKLAPDRLRFHIAVVNELDRKVAYRFGTVRGRFAAFHPLFRAREADALNQEGVTAGGIASTDGSVSIAKWSKGVLAPWAFRRAFPAASSTDLSLADQTNLGIAAIGRLGLIRRLVAAQISRRGEQGYVLSDGPGSCGGSFMR